jgi:peptide deformylase
LQIVTYPHPTLRHKSQPIKRVDANLRKMVSQMFELMYEARGVGLAANQVDLPFRLFVANLQSDPEEGEELVFINPVISRPKGLEEKEEGCLSLPELYGPVKRPETVQVTAYTLRGEEIEAKLSGFAARVVQHETDHLDGVMFIDRLSETEAMAARESIEEFELSFAGRRQRQEIPLDNDILQRLLDLENQYC